MLFFPIRDDNPRILIDKPYVTWGIAALCTTIFLLQISGGPHFSQQTSFSFGLIPARLTGVADLPPELRVVPAWATLISSMFLHGGVLHFAGNMLFLLIFADNVEDAMGHPRFLAFYLLCGLAAALAHVAIAPAAPAPMIGASGAISGVLGAYLLLHPRASVTILMIWFPLIVPAWLLLGLWMGFQVFSAVFGAESNIAWWAHIGGFAAGAVLVVPFRHKTIPLGGHRRYPRGVRLKQRRPRSGRPWGDS